MDLIKTSYLKKKKWLNKIKKIKSIVQKWNQRKLTMIGRIQIIKSFILSQVSYTASMLTVPKSIISEFEKIAYKYVWDGKREKIKRKTLIKDYTTGGVKMIDLVLY